MMMPFWFVLWLFWRIMMMLAAESGFVDYFCCVVVVKTYISTHFSLDASTRQCLAYKIQLLIFA